jgi:nucleoid DNA-binding protein
MTTKNELMKFLREAAGLTIAQSTLCANATLEWLALALEKGERVELRGLGSFLVKQTNEKKTALNESGVVPAHGRVAFRPCEKLRRAVWDKKR